MSDAQAPPFDTTDAPTVREITITRVFDAPIERVWAAFTEPERICEWYGPQGFTCPTAEMDLVPGGAFRIIMRSPDGDFPDEGTVEEIEPPTRLVLRHRAPGPDGAPFLEALTTMSFTDEGGKTAFVLTARGEALTDAAVMALGGMEAGWVQSLRKLDDVFADAVDRQTVLMKMLPGPRERVWAALSDPDALAQWWGPDGFTLTTREFDFREGGRWEFTMHGPDGTDYGNVIVFESIDEPFGLRYTHRGTGEHDDVAFVGAIDLDEMLGMSILTLRGIYETTEARDLIVEKYGAIEGGEQTLSRLEAFLTP